MATITVYLDDSAEERRRRRLRIIEVAIIVTLLTPLAVRALRPSFPAGSPASSKVVMQTRDRIVPVYYSLDTIGPPPPPRAAITPSRLEFGEQVVGSGSPAKLVTIANTGGYRLDVNVRARGEGFSMEHSCGAGVNERATCTAAVVFSPQRAGHHSGELTIVARGETTTVMLDGDGRPTKDDDPVMPVVFAKPVARSLWPNVAVAVDRTKILLPRFEPRRIHFIRPGTKRVAISNPHDEPILIRRITVDGIGYELRDDAQCATLLNPGQRCTFRVVALAVSNYTPTARLRVE